MSDYYAFILHAVSRLERNTAESRQSVYGRAGKELDEKLRRSVLRLAESEIEGEQRAFEGAIRRIEAEIANGRSVNRGPVASITPRPLLEPTELAPTIPIDLESEWTGR